jgi:hypothetical protein
MKVSLLIAWSIAFAFFSCAKNKVSIAAGWWKIDRIEIVKNNELVKVLDSCMQYWNIYKADSIEIFERKVLQNCLHIKSGRNSIKSIDPETGKLVKEYFIRLQNDQQLELFSNERLGEDIYDVIYYLTRMSKPLVIGDTLPSATKNVFSGYRTNLNYIRNAKRDCMSAGYGE